ncbi:MAG: HNH endonuclease [Anaerolineae bacterium]|nr:HNH endonuclease [Anaerolineae bacterium]
MRRPTQQFVFQHVYEMASMVEECLENEGSLIEVDWDDSEVIQGLASFSKISLLHRYIYAMIAVEHRREYRKNADLYEEWPESIRGVERLLESYDIPFLPYKKYRPSIPADEATTRGEYSFHQWFLSQEAEFEWLWERLTEEVFHILFGNRSFLLRFNQAVAKYIWSDRVVIPETLLDATGCFRRVYLPTWVKDAVYFRDHGRCVLCQVDLSGLLSPDRVDHFDHMVPLALHGINDPCNIQLLCERCNLQKGDRIAVTGTRYSPWWTE